MKIHKLYGKKKLGMRSRATARVLKRINGEPSVQVRSSLQGLRVTQWTRSGDARAPLSRGCTRAGHSTSRAPASQGRSRLGPGCPLSLTSCAAWGVHLASLSLTWLLCPSPGLPIKQGPYGLLSSQTVVLNGKGRHTQSANCKGSERVRLAHPWGLSQVDTPTDLVILCKKSSCPTFLGNACWSRSDFLEMCSVDQLQPTEPERLA